MTTRTLPLLALALGGALGASLGGCVGNAATIELAGVCAPPIVANPCLGFIDGKCDNGILGTTPFVYTSVEGVPNDLELPVSIFNQMSNNADASYGQVNTHDADIEEWVYSFDTGGYPIQDTTWTVPAGGTTVPAGIATTPGAAAPLVPLLPLQISVELAKAIPVNTTATIVSHIRAKGHFKDGSAFETAPYLVAIDVINENVTYSCQTAGSTPAFCPKPGQTMAEPFVCIPAP